MFDLTPVMLLRAYSHGLFPMAESAESEELYWVNPDRRGILPLDTFHVPRKLRRIVRLGEFDIRINTVFREVLACCASSRPTTWINREIADLYGRLHDLGHAHSVEAWRGGELVGGLYGVSLGGAFFGESMFSKVAESSKVALVHLAIRLRRGGFTLLDTQFITAHLSQFGAIEIEREAYQHLLDAALTIDADFNQTAPEPQDFEALFGVARAVLTASRTLTPLRMMLSTTRP